MARLIDLTTYPVKDVLPLLLVDKTTRRNIVDSQRDPYVAPTDIQPRTAKALDQQNERTRKNAEVFTPSWICCQMNNFLDEEWFGGSCPFGTLEGEKWTPSVGKIPFKTPKGWQKYIWSPRLEITCGEAPFLVSRYDAATGRIIPVRERIGLLDRKLRVVGEYAETEAEWLKWAKAAFRSVYGYEFQGDSLLIARINLLCTFVDYLADRWNRFATPKELREIAGIIGWNLWQMDGRNNSVPFAVDEKKKKAKAIAGQYDLDWKTFGETDDEPEWVRDPLLAQIYNWKARKAKKTIFKHISIPGESTMKFDFVIGNPPYQDETQSKGDRANPLYHIFMDAVEDITDVSVLITPARFLFNAGQTPKEWNRKMLNDEHFKVLMYEPLSARIFPGTDIKGGVAITIRNKKASYGPIGTFTSFPELNSILKKVMAIHGGKKCLDSIISMRGLYRFSESFYEDYPDAKTVVGSGTGNMVVSNIFDKLPDVFFTEKPKDNKKYVKLIGRSKNQRTERFLKKSYLIPNEYIDTYNVLLPEANGSGAIGEVLSTPLVGTPLVGSTDTFISIGKFDNETEVNNCFKYVKSKFARTMLGVLKVTQHNPANTWKYVPLQDFTPDSDIDWSVSVPEIDQQLYRKYGLSEEEIQFIETNVKEME